MAERGVARRALDELRAAIRSGELQEGDRLPSASELMQRYQVSRTTADRILLALRTEGLAVSRAGAGVYVRSFQTIVRDANARLSRSHWGTGRAVQDADTGPRSRVVQVEISTTAAPNHVALAMGIAEGTPVALRARRFTVDDRAVQISTSYLPLDLATKAGLLHENTGPGGTYARLAEVGRGPVRFSERVRARMPTPDEAAALELPLGNPVVVITRTALDAQDQVVELNEMVLDAAVYELRYEIRA
jgi:GntR family transcriptional regulator